jgi:hypothetical protein
MRQRKNIIGESDRSQMTIWRMRLSYKHTLRICKTYCFSSATNAARTHRSVTLYVMLIKAPIYDVVTQGGGIQYVVFVEIAFPET